jgi:hypothetical protein
MTEVKRARQSMSVGCLAFFHNAGTKNMAAVFESDKSVQIHQNGCILSASRRNGFKRVDVAGAARK